MTDPQLDGMTLAQRLTQGPLEPGKALNILEQLLTSLEASRDPGLVHGSISPQRIILTPDGKATLMGFPGRDPGAQPMGRFGHGAEAPGFVSPEQIADDPISRRTDDVYYRILYKPSPHVPEAALVGLPASVGPAIDRAMAKEPQGRYADAKSFMRALRTNAAPVAAVPVAPVRHRRERGGRGWMRHALAGGVIVLPLIIGLGVAYAKATTTTARLTHETTTVKKAATITVTVANKTYNGSAQHPTVTTGPAGLSVSYSSSPTSAGYTGSKATSFTIEKVTPILPCPNRTVAYDGSDYYLTGAVTGIGGVVLSDLSHGSCSAIGVHDVSVSHPGNGNYNSIPSQLRQLTIQ